MDAETWLRAEDMVWEGGHEPLSEGAATAVAERPAEPEPEPQTEANSAWVDLDSAARETVPSSGFEPGGGAPLTRQQSYVVTVLLLLAAALALLPLLMVLGWRRTHELDQGATYIGLVAAAVTLLGWVPAWRCVTLLRDRASPALTFLAVFLGTATLFTGCAAFAAGTRV